MGGPNKRFVPSLESLQKWDVELIYDRFKNVEIFIGNSDSIKYIDKIIKEYGKEEK